MHSIDWKAGIVGLLPRAPPHGLPGMVVFKVARLPMGQLRAPNGNVPRGPGRRYKEPSFRSPTVSLVLHSISLANQEGQPRFKGKEIILFLSKSTVTWVSRKAD